MALPQLVLSGFNFKPAQDIQTDGRTERQTNRQTDRQRDQTDRETNMR